MKFPLLLALLLCPGSADRACAEVTVKPAGQFTETTWQLGAPPAEINTPAADLLEVRKRFGPNAKLPSPVVTPRRRTEVPLRGFARRVAARLAHSIAPGQ
ncbi:MAG: hypothetical protein HZA90_04080 [Verrucomicrobia bacterium]|nr:hypothetical protein [Verrucomicrobiota bacterium]